MKTVGSHTSTLTCNCDVSFCSPLSKACVQRLESRRPVSCDAEYEEAAAAAGASSSTREVVVEVGWRPLDEIKAAVRQRDEGEDAWLHKFAKHVRFAPPQPLLQPFARNFEP